VDVLLTHSLVMALDPKQDRRQRPYPPLGTLYAAAALRDAGYRVNVFDPMLHGDWEHGFAEAVDRGNPRVLAVCEDSFNWLTKMCLGRMRRVALRMLGVAAEEGLPAVVAGSDATDDPLPFLDAGARAVVIGEAENPLVEAVGTLLGGGLLEHVPGLALAASDGGVARTAPRPPEPRADRFPWPARDLVDLGAYGRAWREAHGRFSTNMAASRGCPYHCNWCAKPIWGQHYALRDPADVAAELEHVVGDHGADHIWFADDIFGLTADWTVALGQAMRQRRLRVPFQIQSRVDLISAPAADGLAEAGCEEVWLGVESGSQRVLDAMEKGTRLEQVGLAAGRLRRRGMRVGFFLQLGYPGETWDDIEATARLVRELLPDAIGVSVSYPLPGTGFYARVAQSMGRRRHWQHSGDLAMMFRGTYTTEVYRRLHDLLHDELDARRALACARGGDGDPAEAEAAVQQVAARWRILAAEAPGYRNEDPTVLASAIHAGTRLG
jgi:anaerobic magnesium-protoporphyrin IX monomethyl ester cyclase